MSLSEISGFDKGVRECRILWLSTINNSPSRIRNSIVPGVFVTTSSRESSAAIRVGESSIPCEATAISIVYRRQHMLSSESIAAPPHASAPVRRDQPRHRFPSEELEHPTPQLGSHLLPEGIDVEDPRSSASVTIGPDAHHRDQLDRRIPIGGIRMQLLALELAAPGSGPIRRGLDVMHELGSGLLIGPGHQLAECAIDSHEQPVSLVITNALDQRDSRVDARVCCGSR